MHWSYDTVWDSHQVVAEITYFGLVVSSVPYPLKPPFSHTSFSTELGLMCGSWMRCDRRWFLLTTNLLTSIPSL